LLISFRAEAKQARTTKIETAKALGIEVSAPHATADELIK
jgi:hypothetical protein